MLDIAEVGDYRELLRQYYVQRKLEFPLYSYRMMGQKLDLETSQVFRILNKELHLPTRCIPFAKEMLGLSGRSGELFEILVAAGKTRQKSRKDKLYGMAMSLRDVELRELESDELQFLGKWWIPVVRSAIELNGGDANPSRLQKQIMPALSREQIAEAVRVLKDLGFLTPLASGRFGMAKLHFSAAGKPKAQAIRNYQNQLLDLAQNALVNIDPNERNISSLMVSVDDECYRDLQEMTREYRRQIQKRVEEVGKANRVFQIVVSLFPVTDKVEAS